MVMTLVRRCQTLVRRVDTMSDTRSMVMTSVCRFETMWDTRSMVMTLVRRVETVGYQINGHDISATF